MIIRTSAGVGALQQYTNDRQMLSRAIERVKWSPRYGGGSVAFEQTLDATNPGGVPGGVDADRTSPRDFDERRRERFTVGTLGSLDFIVRGMRELPGRKAVVLFSDGFPLRDSRGDTAGMRALRERMGAQGRGPGGPGGPRGRGAFGGAQPGNRA